MLWSLFAVFLKIGLVSFGGGYAMIPLIRHEVLLHGWMEERQFTDAVALAGMAPGPIATNSATLIGYEAAGVPGAILSTLGMVLPSMAIIVLIAAFFFRMQQRPWVKATFYGLKPVVTGMIVYAAIHFSLPGSGADWMSWHTVGMLIILAVCLGALIKYRLHPLAVIALSGVLGIAFFQ
ncbi:chromate transporter [Paenibacillus oleatilyticus]|uniref:Chromate transporter n=1 Tax=Paenibacillus oleatilyticus TaxID=2594886 RepID=A0ABV4UXB6_9BACL